MVETDWGWEAGFVLVPACRACFWSKHFSALKAPKKPQAPPAKPLNCPVYRSFRACEFGAIFSFLSFLLDVGSTNAVYWMALEVNLPNL